MKSIILFCILLSYCNVFTCEAYKILGIFPTYGRSHHIIFSTFVEELASRGHEVTVINYFPMNKTPNLRQIALDGSDSDSDKMDVDENLKRIPNSIFVDFYRAFDMSVAFREMAKHDCEKLMTNPQVKKMIADGEKYDLVIAEQFVTDCGLAIAFKLNTPAIGMAAHILMPWTFSRLGAPNNPSFVPNHLFASGTRPNLWQKIKSLVINLSMNAYYRSVIQKNNQEIVNKLYPEVPDLEILGNNISLILVNQYVPLTGSRLHGANVIEVGGMHVKDTQIKDKELQDFLNKSKKGVIYISFGSIAQNIPSEILKEIMVFINITDFNFVWKVDTVFEKTAPNLFLGKWLPQSAILCHPNVVAFVTHSGMLSTTEAIHCGVPLISVPLFGDQFSNAQASAEKGLGVVLDIYSLTSKTLGEALNTVLQDSYQSRAKELSKLWRDRPLSAMDTAVYWVEYAARHQTKVDAIPSSAKLNILEYFLIDVLLVLLALNTIIIYAIVKIFRKVFQRKTRRPNKKMKSH